MSGGRSLRKWLYRELDAEASPEGLSVTNKVIFAVIIVSIIFGIAATEPTIEAAFGDRLILIDRVFAGLFALELLARLWASGLNPRFAGSMGPFKFLVRPATLADLAVILPAFLAAPPTWVMIFRLLRILRLVRLGTFPKFHQAMTEFWEALVNKRFEFALSSFLGLLLVTVASTVLYLIEKDVQPEAFGSIPRAIWWSVITFTTVGYGDTVPATDLGKFFAGTFAILGVGLVAMLTGIVASALSDAADIHARNENGTDDVRPGD
ncbi:MAG: potassium channel family protein [Pseudomonadota bacterium]